MDVNIIFTDMHAHTAACEKGEATTTADNTPKVGTTITPTQNGKQSAGEKAESGVVAVEGGKDEFDEAKKYDAVVDLLGGQ